MGLFKKKPQLDPVALAQAQQQREQQEVEQAFRKGITALRDFMSTAIRGSCTPAGCPGSSTWTR